MPNSGLYPEANDASNAIAKQFGGQANPIQQANQIGHLFHESMQPAEDTEEVQPSEAEGHQANMELARKVAEQQYMAQHGVDEQGNPTNKKDKTVLTSYSATEPDEGGM